jgi:hypothetical protein
MEGSDVAGSKIQDNREGYRCELGRREVPRRVSSEAKRGEGMHVKAKYCNWSRQSRVESSQEASCALSVLWVFCLGG